MLQFVDNQMRLIMQNVFDSRCRYKEAILRGLEELVEVIIGEHNFNNICSTQMPLYSCNVQKELLDKVVNETKKKSVTNNCNKRNAWLSRVRRENDC